MRLDNPTSFSALMVGSNNTANTGAVTVGAAATTVVEQSAAIAVEAGDIVIATFNLEMLKGGVAGFSYMYIDGGAGHTATVGFPTAGIWPHHLQHGVPAGNNFINTLTAIGNVSASGNLVLRARAISDGSDSTVAIGKGGVGVVVLR